jgi:hypothetical protein
MTRLLATLALLLSLAPFAGCGDGLDAPGMQARMIHGADADAVMREAEVLLRREFGGLANASARRMESAPRERGSARDSGSARDLVGGTATMRERAIFSVSPRGANTMASLRILVEREDADRRAASGLRADESRLSDTPSYTAIERDAATSTRQNKVWTFVKRNMSLERALLAELAEELTPYVEPVEAADAAPPAE